MKAVIIGGTKGMGRALARKAAERGDRLFLLGRDDDDLARSAADLQVHDREGKKVGHFVCDMERPESFAAALDAADAALGDFDTLVVTAGMFATQDRLEEDPELLARLLTVNFTNTVLLCEAARKRLLARGGGTLCVFSSVAGDRGRKPVVLYGASKAGLSAYLEGLDHRYRAAGLRTICVKPGFVRTAMTQGLKPPPFAGEPEGVAERVLAAIDGGKPETYAPGMWWLVMMVIKSLPRFVMRRVGF
jgi:decaprenylphospho-beta-D-erythro-pentofuranosid-2-ulose 2-reductase